MNELWQAPAPVDWIGLLSTGSVQVVLSLMIVALLFGTVVTKRAYDDMKDQMQARIDEWKLIAMRNIEANEKLASQNVESARLFAEAQTTRLMNGGK